MKFGKRHYFLFLILTLVFDSAQAQVNFSSDDALYVDPLQWLKNLEENTAELMKKSDFLDTATAKVQLNEREGKIVEIKKIAIRNKVLTKSNLAGLVKESTLLFNVAFDCGRCQKTHINPASGYIIDEEGIVVTNHHVVESYIDGGRKNLAMSVQTSNGKIYFVTEILASDKKQDLCIVRVDTKGDKLKALPLGHAAKQGDEIFVMGHPNQMLFYFTEGIVARNYLKWHGGPGKRVSSPEMEITADYAGGSSGGPVVDRNGNLVSTVSSTRSIYYNPSEQKNLQMVVKTTKPVVSLKKMINWK